MTARQSRLKLIVAEIAHGAKLFVRHLLRGKLKQAPAALIVCWPLIAAPGGVAVDLRHYWPSPAAGRQLVIQTEASQGGNVWLGTTHRYVNRGKVRGADVLRLDDFGAPGWLDAWELRNDGAQTLEVADWFPSGHKVYEVGREISWGGIQSVGDVIARTIHVDVAASTGETVGPQNWGTQQLTFEAQGPLTLPSGLTFPDTVQLRMFQSFCLTYACTWPAEQATWVTRHWFAPGVGIVQTQYLKAPGQAFDPPRIDYATSITTTWETP